MIEAAPLNRKEPEDEFIKTLTELGRDERI